MSKEYYYSTINRINYYVLMCVYSFMDKIVLTISLKILSCSNLSMVAFLTSSWAFSAKPDSRAKIS